MSGHRTKAERRVDELAAEKRQLAAVVYPTDDQRRRLAVISTLELPKAWRAVNQAREPR